MAPKKKFARLADVDPSRLAEDVAAAIRQHLVRIGLDDASVPPSVLGRVSSAVVSVAEYATRGTPLAQPLAESLAIIAWAVWGRPVDDELPGYARTTPDVLESTWAGHLVLVMRAAEAREKLGRGKAITGTELAILANSSAANIRYAVTNGLLKGRREADGWTFSAAEARKHLEKGSV